MVLVTAVRSAITAPPAPASKPIAKPTKGQTSHADDVAAKDAPLKSLFPSEPKVSKVHALSHFDKLPQNPCAHNHCMTQQYTKSACGC